VPDAGADRDQGLRGYRPLRATSSPPSFQVLSTSDPARVQEVRAGIDLARDFLGSYGPTHVYVLGLREGSALEDEERAEFVREFCLRRWGGGSGELPEWLERDGQRLFEVLLAGEAEAYCSYVDATEPPMVELIFINVDVWGSPGEPVPDPTLRGIHEYVHVFQHGFAPTPTWMMEGGAMFFEVALPWREGMREPHDTMRHCMQQAQRMVELGLSIADMEEIDDAPEGVREYHRELAYDAGAWAVAYMIQRSGSRRLDSLRDELYPLVDELGWQEAVARYAGCEDVDAFYAAFEAFLAEPLEQQLAALDRLVL